MKRIRFGMLAAMVLCLTSAGCLLPLGCKSASSFKKIAEHYYVQTTNVNGFVQTLLLNLKHGDGASVATGPIPLPIEGDHGEYVQVVSPDGHDSWRQAKDGHFLSREDISGFTLALDRVSLPGWGLILKNAGGRDCGLWAITNVICKPITWTDDLRDAETLQHVRMPDKVRWTWQLASPDGKPGAEIVVEYAHINDCMWAATITDMANGAHDNHRCNGYPCGDGTRCYDVVVDPDGVSHDVGIRMYTPSAPVVRGR